jgi:hypothetical protein
VYCQTLFIWCPSLCAIAIQQKQIRSWPTDLNYKLKGPSRSRLKFDNTCRVYPSIHVKDLSSHTLADDPFTDHNVPCHEKVRRQALPTVHYHWCAPTNFRSSLSNRFPVPFNHISFSLQVLAIVALRVHTNTTQPRSQYAGLTFRTAARTLLKLVRSHTTRTHTTRLFVCTLRMPVDAHAQTVCTLTCM